MYFGTGDAVPEDLKSRAAVARRARAKTNRSAACETCPALKRGCMILPPRVDERPRALVRFEEVAADGPQFTIQREKRLRHQSHRSCIGHCCAAWRELAHPLPNVCEDSSAVSLELQIPLNGIQAGNPEAAATCSE
jgi:hypothetical protein